jgi:hypothetical protein
MINATMPPSTFDNLVDDEFRFLYIIIYFSSFCKKTTFLAPISTHLFRLDNVYSGDTCKLNCTIRLIL